MSTIIIITPPPKKEPTLEAASSGIGTPYIEAVRLIEQAELDGASVRIIET